ncbi:four helix bundle protein [Carboxylicivirga sp. RSCT41]|uniref:four helix bundle protein n=1 Tax=Carboxylicivirga agarovorans TaxID=3417570 RepID=UPI003D349865
MKSQLIRCPSSIAAKYRAACLAQSKATYIAKLSIVIEDADECEFWMEMIIDKELVAVDSVGKLINEAHELASIFIVTRKSLRNN